MSNRKQALYILQKLRHSGFQALFAGGCVRDMLLRRRANDYDVVTNALPNQIIRLFKKTLHIGAKFGVVMVLLDGKQIEVATFRTEGGYTDGRHPGHVQFATAKEDALRRDFTINGMFYDPIRREILDFVGGKRDIQKKIVRTIGPADQRFGEDYLRMLRALRFAVRFDFEIEKQTWQAIVQLSDKIAAISAERIAGEIEGILSSPNRKLGATLLLNSGLADRIFAGMEKWQFLSAIEILGYLPSKIGWPAILAAFFANIEFHQALNYLETLKASRDLIKHVGFLLKHHNDLLEENLPLAKLKMLAADPYFQDLIKLQKAIQKTAGQRLQNLRIIAQRVSAMDPNALKPKPLLDGHEIMALGAPGGPKLGVLSREMYFAQLSEEISTPAQAKQWIKKWLEKHHK